MSEPDFMAEPTGPGEQQTDQKSSQGGFLDWLVSLFAGGGDPEKEKKRLIKQIGKELSKQRIKFYRPKSEEALPGMAKFFFEIYKTVGPAQTLVQHAESSSVLRAIVIESFLTDEQRRLREKFEEEQVREMMNSMDAKQVADIIKDAMVKFFGGFESDTISKINETYNLLMDFTNFIHFDYYFLLKKFDSALQESQFSYTPKFESINAEYISDDLKDFLELLYSIEKKADWDRAFDILRDYKGVDVVSRPDWIKLLNQLEAVKKSNILLLIIRHVDQDPYYKGSIRTSNEKIVEAHLNKLKTQTEMTIQKILKEQKNQKIEKLLQLIFGSTAVVRTKNYTEKANMAFAKKMLAGFTLTAPLNYLKAFLLDYFKKDVREIVQDILLVRSKWTTNIMSQQISEAFHQTMRISESLITFDDSLSEEGELGQKLKKASTRADRDKAALGALKQLLSEINNRAAKMINESAQHLIAIGKHLKMLIEDYEKKNHALILNWREIDLAAENNVKERMLDIYKKIYYFVQLLQIYLKK